MMITSERELYIYVSMLVLLLVYTIYAVSKMIAFKSKVKNKIKKNSKLKKLPGFLETCFGDITKAMTEENMEVVKAHMLSAGIEPQSLNRTKTRDFLNSFVEKYASGSKYSRITEEYGKGIIDFVYANLQIKLGIGPKYKKLRKKINAKMSSLTTDEIKKYMEENYKGEISRELAESIKDSITSNATASIADNLQTQMQNDMQNDMQRQMQNDMQLQMQLDMQQQMMFDMQNQMQMQMQLDLQNQMQLQMQMDMQMQMQQQMMMDMQQQMTADLQNTMYQSQMAITPMHDGGHMLDMNNMHMGGL